MNQNGFAPIIIIAIVGVVLAVAGASYVLIDNEDSVVPLPKDEDLTRCTEEAKVCPDGSAVGRTGPNCEFAECPSEALCEGEACTDGSVVDDIDTSNWKTYRNEEYGFEFFIPKTYKEQKRYDGGGILFYTYSADESFSGTMSIDYFEDVNKVWFPGKDSVGENYVLNGILWKYAGQLSYCDAGECSVDYDTYITEVGDERYVAEFYGESNHRKILSTFKFIEPVDTSDWKTYRNEEYGFEFQYPVGFYLEKGEGSEELVYVARLAPDDPKRASSLGLYSTMTFYLEDRNLDDVVSEYSTRLDANIKDFHGNDPHPSWVDIRSNRHGEDVSKGNTPGRALARYDAYGGGVTWHYVYELSGGRGLLRVFSPTGSSGEWGGILESLEFFDPTDTSNWKIYRNEEYGFEFQYPAQYQDEVLELPNYGRKAGIYLEKPYVRWGDELMTLYRFNIPPVKEGAHETLFVRVFPIDLYSFPYVSGGKELLYDSEEGTWQIKDARNLAMPWPMEKNEFGGFLLGTGDAGEGIELIAMPHKENNIMIEVGRRYSAFKEQGSPDLNTILSTFKFIEQ